MDDFLLFLEQGLDHILDTDGIDHLLFILAITVFFSIKEWKKLLILISAFTIGHSITLMLSVFEILVVNRDIIELLIPITIIITCINNLFKVYKPSKINYPLLYAMVLIFGSIHGLAFSNFLKMALFEEDAILLPLLGFNLGIEVGQLVIVLIFLTLQQVLKLAIPVLKQKQLIISTSILISFAASWILFQLISG